MRLRTERRIRELMGDQEDSGSDSEEEGSIAKPVHQGMRTISLLEWCMVCCGSSLCCVLPSSMHCFDTQLSDRGLLVVHYEGKEDKDERRQLRYIALVLWGTVLLVLVLSCCVGLCLLVHEFFLSQMKMTHQLCHFCNNNLPVFKEGKFLSLLSFLTRLPWSLLALQPK